MYNDNTLTNPSVLTDISMGSDDHFLVYTFSDNTIVVLFEFVFDLPIVNCYPISQVKLDFVCRNCLDINKFEDNKPACMGETSTGETIFVNFEINYLNNNFIEPITSKRWFEF